MWSWWVKTKDTTQVMYIAKLKDGPKRATKFWKGFLKWYDGGEENRPIQKGFWCCNVFLISKYQLPLFYLKRLLEIFFFSLSFFNTFFSFFLCSVSLRTRWFWWYLRRKTTFENYFQIAWDGMVNPWLWRYGSCGYISGGCIFWNGVMHANIFRWG
jgi:hypothetical protein